MVASDPEGPKQQEPLSRIEREVLEILERSESEKPPVTDLVRWKAEQQRRQHEVQARRLGDQIRERATPGMLLLFGLLLAVMVFVFRHSSPGLARVAAIAALICLIAPFIIGFRRPSQPAGPKKWRGREVALGDDEPSPIDQLKRWWRDRS